MAIINITNAAKTSLQNNLITARNLCESRKELWQKLTPQKREAWKQNCPDPVISEMWKINQYLKEFFGE